jgi:hypothetical protein
MFRSAKVFLIPYSIAQGDRMATPVQLPLLYPTAIKSLFGAIGSLPGFGFPEVVIELV